MGGNCVSRSKETHELLRAFGDTKLKDLFAKELNEPFDKINESFRELENFRRSLVEIPLKLMKETEVRILSEPKFLDVLKVFAWSVSACNSGSLDRSELHFSNKAPYISVNSEKLSEDALLMYNLLETYFDALATAPVRIVELENSIKRVH